MLDAGEIAAFERDGFVAVRSAVPTELVERCHAEVAAAMATDGVDLDDPTTWTQPVVRLACPESPAFAQAGTQVVLWEAYDQLLQPGTWGRRQGVGGTIPVRFPNQTDPGDAGWHVDGSFEGNDGSYWLNVASRDRGLLALFLLSDVGIDDAPTELKIGSHLDLPGVLAPLGVRGASFIDVARAIPASTFDRPSVFATGTAGDVFICHPFLVHRATWPHRGVRPRAIAQPGVALLVPFRLDGVTPCPVERAILSGLGRAAEPSTP